MRLIILTLLFINIFVLTFLLVKRFGMTFNNKIKQTFNIASKLNGIKKISSVSDKIENLIIKSNIRKFIPSFNKHIVIYSSAVLGLIAGVVIYNYLGNALASLIFFVAFGYIPTLLLNALCDYNNSKIERNFLYFLNILTNFAQLKDDVYFAFEKSVGYVGEPLDGFCKTFLEEVKRGLPVEEALENFKNKLINNRFKLFLKNAQLCVRYGGSFLKLATNNMESIKQLQIEKSRRKNETSLGKMLIYVMIGINVVIGIYMFNLYPDTLQKIRTDFYGQVVVLVNTINLFISFYLSLKLQRLDY